MFFSVLASSPSVILHPSHRDESGGTSPGFSAPQAIFFGKFFFTFVNYMATVNECEKDRVLFPSPRRIGGTLWNSPGEVILARNWRVQLVTEAEGEQRQKQKKKEDPQKT